jgi:hypothetical protein
MLPDLTRLYQPVRPWTHPRHYVDVTTLDHRTHLSKDEAKVLGVEGCGSLQIANLESDEIRAECGHGMSISASGIK